MTPPTGHQTAIPKPLRIRLLRLLFVLALPLMLFSRSAWSEPEILFEILEVTGIFLIIAAVLGRLWSTLYAGDRKNRTVVQDGPYSMCRHPLYFSSTLGVAGFGLMLGSIIIAALLAGLAFTLLSMTARREEEYLRTTFGPSYDDYAARVPMIIPKVSLFRTTDRIDVSVTDLRQNFADALVFLSAIPMAELMEVVKDMHWLPTFPLY